MIRAGILVILLLTFLSESLQAGVPSIRPGGEKESMAFPSMNFWRAAREGDLAIIRQLAAQGLPIDVPDHTGRTPLFYAIERGYTDIVQWLIDEEVDINQKNSDGSLALNVAVTNGHRQVVTMLIKGGAKINQRDRRGESALMKAVLIGDIPMTEELLKAGARVDLADYTGRIPADIASDHRNPRMRNLFLSR